MDFAPELTRAFSLDGKVAVITGGGSGLGAGDGAPFPAGRFVTGQSLAVNGGESM